MDILLFFERQAKILKQYVPINDIIKIILIYHHEHKIVKKKYFSIFKFNPSLNKHNATKYSEEYYMRYNFGSQPYNNTILQKQNPNILILKNVIGAEPGNYMGFKGFELGNFALYCEELPKYQKYFDIVTKKSNKLIYYINNSCDTFDLILYSIDKNIGINFKKSYNWNEKKSEYDAYMFDFNIKTGYYMNDDDTLYINGKLIKVNSSDNPIYFSNEYVKKIIHEYFSKWKRVRICGTKYLEIKTESPETLSILLKEIAEQYLDAYEERSGLNHDDLDLNGIEYGNDSEYSEYSDYSDYSDY
jgi:hypothetical protein